MRDLNYELKQLCRRNRDGSFATRYAREQILTMVANQLYEMGFTEGLSAGTLKNRMTELRWWAEKVAKQGVIAKDNDHYGIARRQYVTNISRARALTSGDLSKITDSYTKISFKLQAAFGLPSPHLCVLARARRGSIA